jgi:hypothetical protein
MKITYVGRTLIYNYPKYSVRVSIRSMFVISVYACIFSLTCRLTPVGQVAVRLPPLASVTGQLS